jgi:hypothetical protein
MSAPEMAPIGGQVAIEVDNDLMLPSRIVDADGRNLALAAPSLIGVATPPVGAQLQIQWASGRGLWVVPGELIAIETEPLPTWRVRIAGEGEVKQRRRFARAPVDGTVSFFSETRPSNVRLGWLQDVSAGGLRCRVPAGGDMAGDRATVRFVVDGETLEITGMLLRCEPSAKGDDEAVIEFPEEHKLAEKLQRFVMQEQMRRRREGLR